MAYDPRFRYIDELVTDLGRIEAARAIVDVLSLPPDVGLRLKQEARTKSTHHSTKIEGNRLRESAIAGVVVQPPERRTPDGVEVRNYWRALEWIELQCESPNVRITGETFLQLHAIILPSAAGRPRKLSSLRTEEVGVIDQSRNDYEYQAPEPRDVPRLVDDLVGWLNGSAAQRLSAPIRAAILAYQFLTIHPFMNGNGRTARALATMELWKSGYGMRGYLSIEEHYTRDLARYYSMLQMGLPANYYQGRNDPDLTPWVSYFCETLAQAASELGRHAVTLHRRVAGFEPYPWERLSRLQQQLLVRCVGVAKENKGEARFTPADLADWFGVHKRTAIELLQNWHEDGFVKPGSGIQRVRSWVLGGEWAELIRPAVDSGPNREPAKDSE